MQENPQATPQTISQVPANWSSMWRLVAPYWRSEEKWRARGLLATIIALALGMVYLNVQFTNWNLAFYNALQDKNLAEFKSQLWRFTWLAFIYIVVAIYRIYLEQGLGMRWRTWMTKNYLHDWLANQAYYRIDQTRTADNPDQRIAEDLKALTAGTLSLTLGLLSSVVTLVSFVGILWSVSGPLAFVFAGQAWTVQGYMVWFALGYALLGSLLVWWIGKPLVGQNFRQQQFEADFRFGLVRIREYAEAVALYRGEERERDQLGQRFERIRANWWTIMRTTKRLNVASNFYAQFANIFPILVASPRYFAGALQLGGLMQISSAFGQVQGSLSWFINAFGSMAEWKASVNRLTGFHAAIEAARSRESGIAIAHNNVGATLIEALVLRLPNGAEQTQPFTMRLRTDQKILVSGPSGCGKSTLFRALAGIWPYGSGSIEVPKNLHRMFLPQRTYLPIGSLRAAVAYPAAADAYRDLAIVHYLTLCQLPHLCERLDEEDNWSQRLSPGEQQRLAFVRALLARPDMVFLDEATSALDAINEEAMYALLAQELPQTGIVSIAHRESVAAFHDSRWQFVAAEAAYVIQVEAIVGGKSQRSQASTNRTQ